MVGGGRLGGGRGVPHPHAGRGGRGDGGAASPYSDIVPSSQILPPEAEGLIKSHPSQLKIAGGSLPKINNGSKVQMIGADRGELILFAGSLTFCPIHTLERGCHLLDISSLLLAQLEHKLIINKNTICFYIKYVSWAFN